MAEVTKLTQIEGLDFELAVLPVEAIEPNPWNPNEMDERTLQAERESIETFGFIDPVTVRAMPKKKGRWQIIDGEHRWRLCPELDIREIPCAILDVTEAMAKKLTIILNETRGEANAVKLGSLLGELQEEDDDLGRGLRYSEAELGHLIDLGVEEAWADSLDGEIEPEDEPEEEAPDDGAFTLFARISEDHRELIEQAVEKAGKRGPVPDEKRLAVGMAIVKMARAYLR